MNPPVAVDMTVLVRAIREEPDPSEPKAVARAKALIKTLADDRTPIILPSIALGEFLAGTPRGDVAKMVQELEKNFVIEPFDHIAAFWAGHIWREHHAIMKAENYGTGKQCIKSDCWIFATALAKGATAIYAQDKWFHTIAREFPSRIEAKYIPNMRDQQKTID